jgi:hypothetical protein
MVGLAIIPSVPAQSGITSMLNLRYPSEVAIQNGVAQATVTVTVYYADYENPQGYLAFGVYDTQTQHVHQGTVSSSPDACQPVGAQYADDAVCMVIPTGYQSGSESVSYALTFNSTGQYALSAETGVMDYQGNEAQGSTSSSDFTIAVTGPPTTTSTTSVTSSASSTASSSAPAQTVIANLQYPAQVVMQNGVAHAAVTYTFQYSGLPAGGYLITGVLYAPHGSDNYAEGSGTSSPDACGSNAGSPYANSTLCYSTHGSSTGTESISFNLVFNETRQNSLYIVALITDSSHNPVTYSFSDFSISVVTSVQSTSSSQPENTTSQAQATMLGFAVIAVIIVVIVGAVILVVRRRKGRTAETAPSARLETPPAPSTGGVEFCGECGARLSPGSDFCGECGARKT